MFSTGAGADAESDVATDLPAGGDARPEVEGGPGEGGAAGVPGARSAGESQELDGEFGPEGYGETEYADADADADDSAEAPFFGMQSEGLILTGIALGPSLRRLARVCLAAAIGLGVLFWTALVLVYGYRVFLQGGSTNPDMPHLADGRPWAAYYLVGALWAVAIGAWGLATRGGFIRLTWCFACLVTAFFWPLGLAASIAAVAIRRPGAAMSRRLLLSGLAVLVAAGGFAWRVDAPDSNAEQALVAADTDLLGAWHSRSGMTVDLRPDGTFDASTLTGGGLRDGEPIPASAGRWESESADGHSGVRLLVDGDLSNSLWFDLYKAGPDLLLCSSSDPDDPCQVVLRRS